MFKCDECCCGIFSIELICDIVRTLALSILSERNRKRSTRLATLIISEERIRGWKKKKSVRIQSARTWIVLREIVDHVRDQMTRFTIRTRYSSNTFCRRSAGNVMISATLRSVRVCRRKCGRTAIVRIDILPWRSVISRPREIPKLKRARARDGIHVFHRANVAYLLFGNDDWSSVRFTASVARTIRV